MWLIRARKAGVATGGWDWTEEAEDAVVVGWELEIGRTGGDAEVILGILLLLPFSYRSLVANEKQGKNEKKTKSAPFYFHH